MVGVLNAGACRQNSATIQINKNLLPISYNCIDTWNGGASATGLFADYQPGFGGYDRVRAVFAVSRAASDPIAISAGGNYFAWFWQITNANTLTCTGCRDAVGLWSPSITLSGAGSVPPIVLTMPPSYHESCGGWNGGGNCQWPDAIEATTWGRVKSMYR